MVTKTSHKTEPSEALLLFLRVMLSDGAHEVGCVVPRLASLLSSTRPGSLHTTNARARSPWHPGCPRGVPFLLWCPRAGSKVAMCRFSTSVKRRAVLCTRSISTLGVYSRRIFFLRLTAFPPFTGKPDGTVPVLRPVACWYSGRQSSLCSPDRAIYIQWYLLMCPSLACGLWALSIRRALQRNSRLITQVPMDIPGENGHEK